MCAAFPFSQKRNLKLSLAIDVLACSQIVLGASVQKGAFGTHISPCPSKRKERQKKVLPWYILYSCFRLLRHASVVFVH